MPDPLDQSVPGMPQRFFENLDTKRIVEQLAAAHVDTLLVHTKDNQGNAYYNTKAAHKHSNLGERDMLLEFSRHCRARGLNLLFYVQLTRDRRSFETPEHQARDANGQPVMQFEDNPLLASREERPVVCLNGPHRQYIKNVLQELSSGYDFDGYWLDCFMWWGRTNPCFCEACKAAYLRDTGQEIPKPPHKPEDWRAYFRWRRRLNSFIMHELTDHIHKFNPALTVTHNGSGLPRFADWDFCDKDNYPSNEFHYNEGLVGLSLACEKNRALRPDTPFEIESWRFANRLGPEGFSRGYQVRPVAAILTEMAVTVAHGGFPQYYDQVRPDGTLEPRSLERLTPAYKQVAAAQKSSGVGKPLPYALVLWSKATEAYAPAEPRDLHTDDLEGTYAALIESHVPAGVLSERDLERKAWRDARVIFVPSAECLSGECAAGLTAFVESGGGVVIMGRNGLREADGTQRDNFAVADLIAADFQAMTEKLYSFIQLETGHELTRDLALNFPVSVYETLQVLVRPRATEGIIGRIVNPMPGFHMGYPPHERTESPALIARQAGKGRVVYAAAAFGAAYKRFFHPDFRQLILNCAHWAAGGPPPVHVEAPETVEVVTWREDSRNSTIIHLINRTGAGPAQGIGAMLREVIPVSDIKISLRNPLAGKRAYARIGNASLLISTTNSEMTISLPRLNAWEIIEVV